MNPIIGGVYYVTDAKLTLPPEQKRYVHESRRLVVVISGSETNTDSKWPFVLCCPISGSTTHKTRFDVKLGVGEGGVNKKCWIRVPAVQPLLKEDLEDLSGTLNANRLEELQTRLLEYLGLLGEADVTS